MFKDVPSQWDAWDMDSLYKLCPVALPAKASFEVVAAGPLVAKLHIRRALNQSAMTQDVVLRRDSRRVDFVTTVDWRESHKLLKVAFPVDIHANEALHEIQFGHIRRPNHRSRQFEADRFEVCNHQLVRPGRGEPRLRRAERLQVRAERPGQHDPPDAAEVRPGPRHAGRQGHPGVHLRRLPLERQPGRQRRGAAGLRTQLPRQPGPRRRGRAVAVRVDAANVILETVKPAEDGSADVVLRLYESKRMATRCRLSTSLPIQSARLTDMLETSLRALSCKGNKIALDLRPFEVQTLRLTLGGR